MHTPPAAAPADDALVAVGASLKTLLGASRRLRGRETHRPGQLSFAQYSLLFSLADVDELSSRELARLADITPATVTQMLDGLEGAGLVARRRAEHDRRVVLTALTEAGAAVVAERRAQIEPRWRAALAGLGDDELRAAAATMDRIAAFFEDLQQAPDA
jgi:DNA-binding MarR family transcriptional regulator